MARIQQPSAVTLPSLFWRTALQQELIVLLLLEVTQPGRNAEVLTADSLLLECKFTRCYGTATQSGSYPYGSSVQCALP